MHHTSRSYFVHTRNPEITNYQTKATLPGRLIDAVKRMMRPDIIQPRG